LVAWTAVASAQVVRESPAELKKIDVVERLGGRIPLDLRFTDETGSQVRLGDYFASDRPVILVLGYYRCPMLCNLVFNGLADAVQQLDLRLADQYTIITVSIDSVETPQLAAAKKANYVKSMSRGDSLTGWHFLVGEAGQSRALAEAVGFKYYWDEQSKQWAHPALVTLLSPDGVISRYLYGVEFPVRDLRLGLLEASEGKIGNTVDRIILYCYHYDPEAGGYVVFAENVMRLGGVATVILLGALLVFLWVREHRRRSDRMAALTAGEGA
jgi:protein SCO1/2